MAYRSLSRPGKIDRGWNCLFINDLLIFNNGKKKESIVKYSIVILELLMKFQKFWIDGKNVRYNEFIQLYAKYLSSYSKKN